jgi:DNA-binding transcriptional LysR family regulator
VAVRVDDAQLREISSSVKLRHLRYFLAVAEAGSMSEAARRLKVAQSPLSQQIRQLEDRLGAVLFERGRGRAAQLTEAGEALHARAAQIVASVDEASAEVREIATGASGRLRFGAVPTIAPHLTDALAAFCSRHPEASVVFREAGALRLVSELQEREVDLVLVRMPIPELEVDVRNLWEEEFLLALPPDHPLAGERSLSLRAIAGERFVAFNRKKAWYLFQLIESACMREGFRPRVMVDGASFLSVARLVGAGYGVSILPRSAVDPIREPRPALVPIEGRPVVTTIAGLTRRGSRPSGLLEGWIRELERRAADHGAPGP